MTDSGGREDASWSAPRLALDELLGQLVERAQEALATQRRLQELLEANQSIIADLALPVVLRRIVEAACRLAGARYAALGVLAPGGRSLDQFITVGFDEETIDRIGHLPTGKGLLGALIDDPAPIRLERMSDDPRSVGFPAEHPPMSSFLGVPVRVRSEVFGNLYLADSTNGGFSADDEQLVTALAATAGVAIENARLFAQAEHRQQWLEATAVITRQLLSVEGEDPLALIARQAREIADADLVTVVLPTADPDSLLVEVAAGDDADELAGYTYPRSPSVVGAVLDSGKPLSLPDATGSQWPWHQSEVAEVGPAMIVPLAGAQGPRGALAVGRLVGRPTFDDVDVAMANAFANQAALALELADSRADQLRVRVLEDRDRIARDLHDHVIQRLFAVGLSLQGIASRADGSDAPRLERLVTELDTTIAQIRTSVFALRGRNDDATSTRGLVLDVVSDVTATLQTAPSVRFGGPVDTVIADDALDDLLATLREALTNVVRHAGAEHVDVVLDADSRRAVLSVTDDGRGVGDATRRSGLANLRARAERHGGTLDVSPLRSGSDLIANRGREGTRLTWSIDLT